MFQKVITTISNIVTGLSLSMIAPFTFQRTPKSLQVTHALFVAFENSCMDVASPMVPVSVYSRSVPFVPSPLMAFKQIYCTIKKTIQSIVSFQLPMSFPALLILNLNRIYLKNKKCRNKLLKESVFNWTR